MGDTEVQVEKVDCFNVYSIGCSNSFVYAEFADNDSFISGLVEYIFEENNLLNYANRVNKINFSGNEQQYTKLYNNISMFLNIELEKLVYDNVTDELRTVLDEEYEIVDKKGRLCIQNDKVGKIGEYTFHLLLTNYFKLDCILPKFRCTTDRNMSVFGIDTLFLDCNSKTLFFGESKFCKNIGNGIKLINKSLKDYEKQISEEYRIVLSDDDAFKLSNDFEKIFGDVKQICISFEELINKAEITEIAIPIFIAHGDGYDNPDVYIKKMVNKIKQNMFFGINTKYIFISLPVIDKNEFVEKAMKRAVEKQNEYRQSR